MSRHNARAPGVHFPSEVQPDAGAAERSLVLLNNWRAGSAATAIVMSVLLPIAVAWHASYLIALSASIIAAVTIALACHLARERRLSTLAMFPDLARLPDLTAKRARLVSPGYRRALAAGLRRTAASTQPPRRFDCCPVLPDRVTPLRAELLDLADRLEQAQHPDPACVALIRELLVNGNSPLYNPNLPADDLHSALNRARAGITAQPANT